MADNILGFKFPKPVKKGIL